MKWLYEFGKKIKKNVHGIIIKTRFGQKREAQKFADKKFRALSVEEKSERRVCFHNKNKLKQYENMLAEIQISIQKDSRFQHWIDTGLFFANFYHRNDALPPNYQLIIDFSIDELIEINRNSQNKIQNNNLKLLKLVSIYIDRIIAELNKNIEQESYCVENLVKSREYFKRMKTNAAESLEEGLQRILFWSSLFWQTNHTLVGLGRLDKILDKLKRPETDEEVCQIIEDFYLELHRYYGYKSNSILGDTGQLIVLGGLDEDGEYFNNYLTYAFIQTMIYVQLPDPKLLLRVSSKMPQRLLELGTKCIATGLGGPLLANDDVIIPAMQDFGYTMQDAHNYVTSACWETLGYGKAWGRGNLANINFARVLVKTYTDNNFEKCHSFDEIVDLYIKYLKKEVKGCLKKINKIKWEENPLMTFFTEGCVEAGKDISEGGAVYCDYGILSVGLANAIDSLFNIKYLCFEGKRKQTLSGLKTAAQKNYVGAKNIEEELSENSYFGKDDMEVADMVTRFMDTINEICNDYRNPFGGKVKFGLSSPSYVTCGKDCDATLDGRKNNEALSVHISGKNGTAYTSLVNFSGMLNYNGNRVNGSVVDYFVSPDFIEKNFSKFVLFLKSAINVGFFEMQLNVVSSSKLIAAKKNPDLFPDLIVRVWGFSAYFVDLPEEYQDILIHRAIDSERIA